MAGIAQVENGIQGECVECRLAVGPLYTDHSVVSASRRVCNAGGARLRLGGRVPSPEPQPLPTLRTPLSLSQVSKGNIRLTKCPDCAAVADPYVEWEPLAVFTDAVLQKPQVGTWGRGRWEGRREGAGTLLGHASAPLGEASKPS